MPTIAILAGGLATRMRPVTEDIPKSLIEVAGRPFIFWQLESLASMGFRKAVCCVGYLGEKIQEQVGNGHQFGLSVDYSFDGPVLLGTAGAIRRALPLLGKDFFVIYGDSLLDCDPREIFKAYRHSQRPALMTVYQNRNSIEKSNAVFLKGTRSVLYNKKLPHKQASHIDYGLGVYSSHVFLSVRPDVPYDLADLCASLSARGSLAGYEVTNRFYEIGSPEGLRDTEQYLNNRQAASLQAADVRK